MGKLGCSCKADKYTDAETATRSTSRQVGEGTSEKNEGGKSENYKNTSGRGDHYPASSPTLIVSTNKALAISSGSLFKIGTTRMLNLCWRSIMFLRYW